MLRRRASRPFAFAIAITVLLISLEARGQVVLFDDFNGTGNIDWETWRIPFSGDGSFLGRTQLKLDEATEVPQQTGGSAVLELDTFFDSAGTVFSGHEFISRAQFARGGGLTIEYRARLDPTSLIPGVGGVVNGLFLFDVTRENGAGDLIRDEIDAGELLTNEIVNGQNRVLTNLWDEGPFTGPGSGGSPVFVAPGTDLTQFNNYRVEWRQNSVDYYVNDNLVRSETTVVPDDPMSIRANLWVPDAGFGDAFDANLIPASSAGANQQIRAEVDFIRVSRSNTSAGPNLLTNPGFETGDFTGWNTFGNASVENATSDGNLDAFEGDFVAKTFGPFNVNTDATVISQAVPALPGQEFEAIVRAINDTDANGGLDSLSGTNNFGELSIEFLDAGGVLLPSPLGDEFLGENEIVTAVIDGRSPNVIEDRYVTARVNAIAPVGAAFAQIVLPFVQLIDDNGGPDGGALYWDSAELYVLETDVSVDNDGDGDIDGQDFLGLQRNDPSEIPAWQASYPAPLAGSITSVPEPSAALLITLAGLYGLGLGRRR